MECELKDRIRWKKFESRAPARRKRDVEEIDQRKRERSESGVRSSEFGARRRNTTFKHCVETIGI